MFIFVDLFTCKLTYTLFVSVVPQEERKYTLTDEERPPCRFTDRSKRTRRATATMKTWPEAQNAPLIDHIVMSAVAMDARVH
jgi:hypothetical protein